MLLLLITETVLWNYKLFTLDFIHTYVHWKIVKYSDYTYMLWWCVGILVHVCVFVFVYVDGQIPNESNSLVLNIVIVFNYLLT